MSGKEKLITRLKSKPKDFTYEEFRTLLKGLGYIEDNRGKTSGSRVAFIHKNTKKIISIHRPHPSNIMKMYLVLELLEDLDRNGEI